MKPGKGWLGQKKFLVVKRSVRRTRRTHTPAFRAQVAFATLRTSVDLPAAAFQNTATFFVGRTAT